jgi:hypothetical protein
MHPARGCVQADSGKTLFTASGPYSGTEWATGMLLQTERPAGGPPMVTTTPQRGTGVELVWNRPGLVMALLIQSRLKKLT